MIPPLSCFNSLVAEHWNSFCRSLLQILTYSMHHRFQSCSWQKFFHSFIKKYFVLASFFCQYRDIASIGSKEPMIFWLYIIFLWKLVKNCLKNQNFFIKLWPVKLKVNFFKRNIFKILRDLLSDIKNTQNWIVVKFLVH